jgi:hypothetical protein
MALPELYKEQEFQRQTFDRNSQFIKHNPNLTARGTRKFNRYWNSDQRLEDEKTFNAEQDAAEVAHIEAEAKKRAESWDARIAALKEQNAARGAAALKSINASLAAKPVVPASKPVAPATPVAKTLTPKSEADWNRIASEATNGQLKTMADVEAWQRANKFSEDQIDGKFGDYSKSYFTKHSMGNYKPAPLDESSPEFIGPVLKSETPTSTPTPKSNVFNWAKFKDAFGLDTFEYDGKTYARYDPDGLGDFAVGQDGKIYHYASNGKLGLNDITKAPIVYTLDQPHTGTFKENLQMLNGIMAPYRKQGGTMNRINYFQQGGAAPQQDMQQQVIALVQAAMQGDQKATETVNKIMEAAKAGDQQAMQIAQMIQQVAQKMQGQATAAKWGSKLNYIRSLKFAKGGKACPACEKGAPIVEKKACGGKKTLKK